MSSLAERIMSIGMIVAFVVGVGWLFGQILSPIVASQAAEGAAGDRFGLVLSLAEYPLLAIGAAAVTIASFQYFAPSSFGGR